jgi:hypothetical protein
LALHEQRERVGAQGGGVGDAVFYAPGGGDVEADLPGVGDARGVVVWLRGGRGFFGFALSFWSGFSCFESGRYGSDASQ